MWFCVYTTAVTLPLGITSHLDSFSLSACCYTILHPTPPKFFERSSFWVKKLYFAAFVRQPFHGRWLSPSTTWLVTSTSTQNNNNNKLEYKPCGNWVGRKTELENIWEFEYIRNFFFKKVKQRFIGDRELAWIHPMTEYLRKQSFVIETNNNFGWDHRRPLTIYPKTEYIQPWIYPEFTVYTWYAMPRKFCLS